MKKMFFIVFIVVISFISNTLDCFAMDTGIINTNESFSIEENNVYFDEVHFDSYQRGKEQLIGFMGEVKNKSSEDKYLIIDITYYDYNKRKIATDKKNWDIPKNSTVFYNLHSKENKLDCRVENIRYYKISIKDANEEKKESSFSKYRGYIIGIIFVIIILVIIFILRSRYRNSYNEYEEIIKDIEESKYKQVKEQEVIEMLDTSTEFDELEILEDIEELEDDEDDDLEIL